MYNYNQFIIQGLKQDGLVIKDEKKLSKYYLTDKTFGNHQETEEPIKEILV